MRFLRLPLIFHFFIDENDVFEISEWIVADFDSLEGQQLVSEAVKHLVRIFRSLSCFWCFFKNTIAEKYCVYWK